MKNKSIYFLLLLIITSFLFLVSGCSSPTSQTVIESENPETEIVQQENNAGSQESALKIKMVTDVGGVDDKSFNESAWSGLQQAERDLGVTVAYIESRTEDDYAPNFELATQEGNDLIWGVGFLMENTIKNVAAANPAQKYAIVDVSFGDATPSNVVGVTFREEEPAFLVGYIAGKMTESGKVGFLGGMESDVISRFEYGFKAGVSYANQDCEILTEYADSFIDPVKGKELSLKMYGEGADIIFHASGGTGNGLIEAAKELNQYAIGVDMDQSAAAPDNVITSALKRVDNAIYYIVSDLQDGKWNGGSTIVFGLAEGGVDIAPTTGRLVPEEILTEVEIIKLEIINGDITIPKNRDELERFIIE